MGFMCYCSNFSLLFLRLGRDITIVHYKMPKRSNPRKLSFNTLNAPERVFSFSNNYFSLYVKKYRIVSSLSNTIGLLNIDTS